MMDHETPIGRDTSALLLGGFGTELASPPRPIRDGIASPLLFVGAPADMPDTTSLPDVRLAMTRTPSRAAGAIRQTPTLDIVWLAAVDTIEGEMLGDICAAAGERGCNLVCETSLAALDRVTAAIPASLSVQFLVDADPTDRLVALAAARRTRHGVLNDIARDDAMEDRPAAGRGGAHFAPARRPRRPKGWTSRYAHGLCIAR